MEQVDGGMFNKINAILREIEDIAEEAQITLNLHKITLMDYIMIKRGAADYPEHLQGWMMEQIDGDIARLKAKIEELNRVKKEFLVW